jgi:hypothetical protein
MDNGGPLWLEVLAAAQLHGLHVPIVDYVFGLGGRDIVPEQIERVFRETWKAGMLGRAENAVTYLGVRGDENGGRQTMDDGRPILEGLRTQPSVIHPTGNGHKVVTV